MADIVFKDFKGIFFFLSSSLSLSFSLHYLLIISPYLEFDVQTNRVVFHAEQLFNYEVYTSLSVMGRVNVYLNTRLYDLSVRLPYNLVSTTGELHYRINVLYNNSNSVFTTVLVFSVPTATTQNR